MEPMKMYRDMTKDERAQADVKHYFAREVRKIDVERAMADYDNLPKTFRDLMKEGF